MKQFFLVLWITCLCITAAAQSTGNTTGTIYTPTISTTAHKNSIENGLKTLAGVILVNADIARKWVLVYYNPAQCSFDQIKQKIFSLGFSANELKYYSPPILYTKTYSPVKLKSKKG